MLLALVPLAFAVCLAEKVTGRDERNLPQKPDKPQTTTSCTNSCECACSNSDPDPKVNSINAWLPFGSTSQRVESFSVRALVYAEEPSPALYTPRVLYVETPYYFRHLSNGRHQDGVIPSGYTFGRQGDEKVVFKFAEGESVAKARPGENSNVSATLRLFASDGHTPTSSDPYFADLETGTGEVWRFAVKTTESHVLGEFISWKTSRGVTLGKSALGLDVVYDGGCRVRQVLTPSRLAVVETLEDGFSVTAYSV